MRYTIEQEQFLIANSFGRYSHELAELFNNKFKTDITVRDVVNFKRRNKLKSGVDCRFKKGIVPFNKNKKWNDYMPLESQNNSLATTFKKGNIPKNHKPLGSERIDKNGRVEIKVAEPNKWISKQNYIYQSKFGPIPKNHKIIFADGNNRNFDCDNLILVSNKQQIVMNSKGLIKNDPQLTKIGISIANIILKTNEVIRKWKK
ncbi:MAG: HNH endonuclease [Bacilli bacterium]|nr:HNH endonuclease [Bacilli bacterium]